ncbi:MAG: carboxylesterase family protein [Firmicutes bacterium]|nr:carboxylesterase family protein [Bacillota bacterium]
MAEKKRSEAKKGRGWIMLLIILTLILFAVLELGKHTLLGWGLALVLTIGFILLRRGILARRSAWVRLLGWIGLLAAWALILWLSWPPVRPVPAVNVKNPQITPVRHVREGDLTGVYTADHQVEVYAGIPYAAPPVGNLRWREPQPAEPWEGILAADHFAPMSMQTQNLPIYNSLAQIIGYHDYSISLDDQYREPASEDSLYLNIWKPAGDVSGLPVLVYIHGGSLQTGQPWYADYSGEGLAREGVIVVNMGYRLGIFGFFADPELAAESPNGTTGNYGLLDQIAALRWVRDNISAFGGDPDNITLSGESAGSACVTALCTSPLAAGLFERVIAESSTVTAPVPAHSFRSLEDAYKAAANTRKRLGDATIEELRAMPAEALAGELSVHHHITVDGYVLPETPYESYAKGIHNEKAQLQGFNLEESAPFLLFSQANLKNYESRIRRIFPGEYGDRVLALYPATTDAQARSRWAEIDSVLLFTYGHYCWERQAIAQQIPVYVYHFVKDNGRLGAWHSGEEVYLYRNIPADSPLYTQADHRLSEIFSGYILNFMWTGDPNGEGLPHWSSGTATTVLELGDEVKETPAPYQDLYRIMDEMYGFTVSGP